MNVSIDEQNIEIGKCELEELITKIPFQMLRVKFVMRVGQ